jgi:predicted glycosyltransferase
MILPDEVLDGANLIAAADLIVSAGGTMNREAAALGVPRGRFMPDSGRRWTNSQSENRMRRINSRADLMQCRCKKESGITLAASRAPPSPI